MQTAALTASVGGDLSALIACQPMGWLPVLPFCRPIHVVGGSNYPSPDMSWWYSQSRMLGVMPPKTVEVRQQDQGLLTGQQAVQKSSSQVFVD